MRKSREARGKSEAEIIEREREFYKSKAKKEAEISSLDYKAREKDKF